MRKYRTTGAAADLVRVEVLVPRDDRARILDAARVMREDYRAEGESRSLVDTLYDAAFSRFGAKFLWNVRPSRSVDGLRRIARILRENGDMPAWKFAGEIERKLLDAPG